MANGLGVTQWIIFFAVTLIAWITFTYGSRAALSFKKSFGSNAENRMDAIYLFVDGNKIFIYYAVGVLVVPALIWILVGSLPLTLMILGCALVAPRVFFKVMRRKFVTNLEAALPDALAQMAGSMRVGSSLQGSIEAMVSETKGPLSQEFAQVLKECRVGYSFEEALNNLDHRVQSENLSLVLAATNISRDVGGNLGETYEKMADMLRQKLSLEARIDALTSQGKLQGIVVGLLPVAIGLVMFYMEPDTMSYMVGSLAGWIAMGMIGILLFMGGFMIKKIVTIDV